MKISVSVVSKMKRKPPPRLARTARLFSMRAISHLAANKELAFLRGKKEVSVSIVLVGERLSRQLNKKFRRKDRPANVLSFPIYGSTKDLKKEKSRILELGDVIIAPGVVCAEALKAGQLFYAQFCWMLAHGILHLAGFDHERTKRERRVMEKLESHLLLKLVGISR